MLHLAQREKDKDPQTRRPPQEQPPRTRSAFAVRVRLCLWGSLGCWTASRSKRLVCEVAACTCDLLHLGAAVISTMALLVAAALQEKFLRDRSGAEERLKKIFL